MRLAGGEISTIDTVAVAKRFLATKDTTLHQQTQSLEEPADKQGGDISRLSEKRRVNILGRVGLRHTLIGGFSFTQESFRFFKTDGKTLEIFVVDIRVAAMRQPQPQHCTFIGIILEAAV